MFYILSKFLDFLISPLIWICLIFLYSFFCNKPAGKKKLIVAAFSLLYFFSNSFIVNEAFLAWEIPPVALSKLKHYETAIVLTGVTFDRKEQNDRVFFNKGADRLLHTVQLYKEGKIKTILISGGPIPVSGEKKSEAAKLKSVFIYCGVPEQRIILEENSRNTVESARLTGDLIGSSGISKDFLLISSAYHIPRAQACFKKAGINVKAYPVDFYSNDRHTDLRTIFLPSGDALAKWTLLLHEICGYVVYKLMGYS